MTEENQYDNIRKIGMAIAIYVALFTCLFAATFTKYLIFSLSGNTALSLTWIGIALFLLTFVYGLYGILTRPHLIARPGELGAICACIAFTYTACIFLSRIGIYAMPVFLTAFLLTPLSKRKDSFAANLFCVAMVTCALLCEKASGATAETGLAIANTLIIGVFAGTLTVFTLSYQRRRYDFIVKGVAICLSAITLTLALELINLAFSPVALDFSLLKKPFIMCLAAIFAQLILSVFLQPPFEKIFNLLTNSRLNELTDHSSPLIARLIKEAPGTFNHSLAVANLAEVCSTAIGENPYLARAMAYYHDIGKLNNPLFFKENQSTVNPHDGLLPEVSAELIRKHTRDGYALCAKNRIPDKISRITTEHHGTLPISVFYNKAKELTDGDVDIKKYSYDGEIPSTKIAAVIMVCDSAEAAVRAMESNDSEKIESLVSNLIWSRIKSGQFDDCDITLKELNTVKDTIVRAFGGVYHKRIQYPEEK